MPPPPGGVARSPPPDGTAGPCPPGGVARSGEPPPDDLLPPLLLATIASTIAATITTMKTPARMLAVRLPLVVVTPLMLTYRSASDCVAHPTFAASSGATYWGTSMAPCPPPAGPLPNWSTPFASHPSSSRLTSTLPSCATMPSQRGDRSTS
jgi:hypothetical protein